MHKHESAPKTVLFKKNHKAYSMIPFTSRSKTCNKTEVMLLRNTYIYFFLKPRNEKQTRRSPDDDLYLTEGSQPTALGSIFSFK